MNWHLLRKAANSVRRLAFWVLGIADGIDNFALRRIRTKGQRLHTVIASLPVPPIDEDDWSDLGPLIAADTAEGWSEEAYAAVRFKH